MEYQVVGDDITPEEMTEDHSWQSAGARKAGARLAGANHNRMKSTTSDAPRGRNGGNNIKTRILRASRMLQLPREDTKIVIRPRGGLSIVKTGSTVVADAILAATNICTEDLRGDTLCPNIQQTIMVASTPRRENADRYVRVRQIVVLGRTYEDGVANRVKSELRDTLSALSQSIKQLGENFAQLQVTLAAQNDRVSKVESFLENVVAPALTRNADIQPQPGVTGPILHTILSQSEGSSRPQQNQDGQAK
ncbi:hypothetical protein HPB50_015588 [Hyalomma asiaticum]|uniref:Uncharacterized protein n=1 Tax=Hyalomma asiaticum TaxID=266040 RepID=A0ACB7S7M4_HYAAI|nr:hypothetical protein HPB50_015588 [Hyalomma asiaticum]